MYAPSAIVNAISDSLGVKITEQPLPLWRILNLMEAIPEKKWRNQDKGI
jgi:CO/xanthine dehydrogenase Mo-binding subunit